MTMRTETIQTPMPPLDAVIRAHGAWRVLFCALAAVIRPPKPDYHPATLNDRMRRDIGLKPIGEVTRLHAAQRWPGLL